MDMVILIGIQGSGKSTLYRRQFFETHLRLSLDMLKTRHREKRLVEACIAARQRIVIDNTNVGRDERARFLRLARDGGFRTQGYFFEPVPERALEWNRQRTGKAVIPVAGVLGTLKRLERPTWAEGFDELFRVTVDDDGAFVIDEWRAGG